jgi:hypothetical protein
MYNSLSAYMSNALLRGDSESRPSSSPNYGTGAIEGADKRLVEEAIPPHASISRRAPQPNDVESQIQGKLGNANEELARARERWEVLGEGGGEVERGSKCGGNIYTKESHGC